MNSSDSIHFVASALEERPLLSLDMLNALAEKLLELESIAPELHNLAMQTYMDLAQRFSQVVPGSKKRRCLFCIPALLLLEKVCLYHYERYLALPSGLWKQIHFLYQRALNGGYNSVRVRRNKELFSIDIVYQRILLYSLCKPYNLNEAQLQNTLEIIQSRGKNMNILSLRRSDKRFYQYIDLESDFPPGPRYLFHHDDLLCIDVFEGLGMIPLAYQKYSRSFQRYPVQYDTEVIFGLSDIFDAIKNHFRSELLPLETESCRITSLSIEGLSIALAASIHRYAVGEICHIRLTGQISGLYQVCWKQQTDEGLELGLKCLGKRVEAVFSRKGISAGALQKQHKTLLLDRKCLLTPNSCFEPLQSLSIQGRASRLRSPVIYSEAYNLFTLVDVGLREAAS